MVPGEQVTGPAQRPGRLGLLASGIAGRVLDVAPAGPGESAWTDGRVVFLDPGARPADQVAAVAVQASLIAAGSFDPAIARRLLGRPALARRYLAIEGHRALAASEDHLPGRARVLIDRDTASRAGTPAASLALALGRAEVAAPPPGFGTIRPGRLISGAARGQAGADVPDWDPGRRGRGAARTSRPTMPGPSCGSSPTRPAAGAAWPGCCGGWWASDVAPAAALREPGRRSGPAWPPPPGAASCGRPRRPRRRAEAVPPGGTA